MGPRRLGGRLCGLLLGFSSAKSLFSLFVCGLSLGFSSASILVSMGTTLWVWDTFVGVGVIFVLVLGLCEWTVVVVLLVFSSFERLFGVSSLST